MASFLIFNQLPVSQKMWIPRWLEILAQLPSHDLTLQHIP